MGGRWGTVRGGEIKRKMQRQITKREAGAAAMRKGSVGSITGIVNEIKA